MKIRGGPAAVIGEVVLPRDQVFILVRSLSRSTLGGRPWGILMIREPEDLLGDIYFGVLMVKGPGKTNVFSWVPFLFGKKIVVHSKKRSKKRRYEP